MKNNKFNLEEKIQKMDRYKYFYSYWHHTSQQSILAPSDQKLCGAATLSVTPETTKSFEATFRCCDNCSIIWFLLYPQDL